MKAVRSFLSFASIVVILAGCAGPSVFQGAIPVTTTSQPNSSFALFSPSEAVQASNVPAQSNSSHDASPAPSPTLSPANGEGSINELWDGTFRFYEKASLFGAPYDEEYAFQVDASIWKPMALIDNGEWTVFTLATIQKPVCSLEVRVLEGPADDLQQIISVQNRYRRMGVFNSAGLVFDIFSFTSNHESLADTQHVVYILTDIYGDQPYMLRPNFHAISSFEEWEKCRPLVRGMLATLSMKRVSPGK